MRRSCPGRHHIAGSAASQHHLDQRVGGQRPVRLIELRAAGGSYNEGDAEVVAALAGSQLNAAGIECGVKLPGDQAHGLHKARHIASHDLDRKLARVRDQGRSVALAAVVGTDGRLSGHGSG